MKGFGTAADPIDAEGYPELIDVRTDPVNHPSHYEGFGDGGVIGVVEHLDFCRGSAVKYLCRAGRKDGADELEDLRKAAWYVRREIQRIETEEEA